MILLFIFSSTWNNKATMKEMLAAGDVQTKPVENLLAALQLIGND